MYVLERKSSRVRFTLDELLVQIEPPAPIGCCRRKISWSISVLFLTHFRALQGVGPSKGPHRPGSTPWCGPRWRPE